jgi:hypothetical protein
MSDIPFECGCDSNGPFAVHESLRRPRLRLSPFFVAAKITKNFPVSVFEFVVGVPGGVKLDGRIGIGQCVGSNA